ncbi:TPA: hypothetical protein DIC20_01280 [Candidatus Dependentiae bacterium]|nr:MAG: hypothetical protein US03_C0002G0136 [candidate division TM6 bacterium GW2011_GWF2_36_131]KKQ03569.1 MAG: hypothetical protein US13_C0002G0135 [candidate division TM6 bacterium GW2011_GWE2_36_25]KKQ20155.1 MAG: hypothetical protein US32_C0001G0052 [candidate division TM6 bacterium GW2011_GWA2_36_9]HBR70697.1 hypothetical protein [Candidatus Dependentiae bacterium]HCU00317.1 hypothetical protein [Candidatus Dependentiae bacterium]
MIHSKNHKGFSLIEAVIAIAIIGIFFVSVILLQMGSFQKDIRYSAQLERVLLLKNVLYSPEVIRDQHDKEVEKIQEVKEPQTKITLDIKLQEKKNNLEHIIAQASWDGLVRKEEEKLLLLQFKVPQKKEKS